MGELRKKIGNEIQAKGIIMMQKFSKVSPGLGPFSFKIGR